MNNKLTPEQEKKLIESVNRQLEWLLTNNEYNELRGEGVVCVEQKINVNIRLIRI